MSAPTNPEMKVRPVFDGPIHIEGGAWSKRMSGARCRECGTVTLQGRAICPGCWKQNTQEPLELSHHGTLYSYTIVRNPPAGMPGPYAIAYVDLPERLRLMVRAGVDIERIPIGTEVSIEVAPINTEDDGTIVVGPVLRGAHSGNGVSS